METPMYPERYIVKDIVQESHDSVTLALTATAHFKSTPMLPGQFNMLYVFGIGEIPVSVSGYDNNKHLISHTIRAVGKVSTALTKVKNDDEIGVRGPLGTHWPLKQTKGKHIILIAGGIGLAPLRPALHLLNAHHKDYLSITCLIGARTPDDLLYQAELKQYCRAPQLNINIIVDHALSTWRGQVGVVTSLLPGAIKEPENTIVMMCGPEIMMQFALQVLLKEHIEPSHIYLSIERNMQCGVGWCGHCQWGPFFICKDGPVFCYADIARFFRMKFL